MSKVAVILSNVISTLKEIGGPPTYVNTIANTTDGSSSQVEAVDRSFGGIPEDQFPHFSILYKGETRDMEPSYVKSHLSVQIAIFFYNIDEISIANWISDVEVALAQDVRRGTTYVHDTWIQTIQRDDNAVEPFRRVNMNLEIIYSYQFGQP